MLLILSVIMIIISTLYLIIKKNIKENQRKIELIMTNYQKKNQSNIKLMKFIMLNNLKQIINLKNENDNIKKKLNGLDDLVKYLYLRNIIKVILASLIIKYSKDINIFEDNNGFINFFFIATNNLSSQNAQILNKFKEKFYNNYYKKLNNYIHLNFEDNKTQPLNYYLFNEHDSSNELLKKSLELLMKENIISLKEKEIIFNGLINTDFNIYKKEQEIQNLLKSIKYNF